MRLLSWVSCSPCTGAVRSRRKTGKIVLRRPRSCQLTLATPPHHMHEMHTALLVTRHDAHFAPAWVAAGYLGYWGSLAGAASKEAREEAGLKLG